MEEEQYWIWLSRIEGLNAKDKQKLLLAFERPEKIWQAKEEELKKAGIRGELRKNILHPKSRQNLDVYLKYMKQHNIKMINLYDEKYPKQLKQIYDYPSVLYVRGDSSILERDSFAVIGCRNCSQYGKSAAEKLAYDLAKDHKIVISGLARGIDTHAHIGCMKAGGKTIAVLGHGLDMIYPPENKNLAKNILQTGGVLISEYIIGTKPVAMNFPARNRIISALSLGVIVVEARQKSGALITVDFALEQGKDVYAVPGNIDRLTSEGTNELIKQGAIPITKIGDILKIT